MGDIFQWIWWISWGLSVITVPSILVQRAGRPSTTLSWILALFILPPVVLPSWWLVGRTHLIVRYGRRYYPESAFKEKLRTHQCEIGQMVQTSMALRQITNLPENLRNWVFQPTSGNLVQLIKGGETVYTAWEQAINSAKEHIHLLFYEWRNDATGKRMLDVLIAASKRGAEVRLLVDAIGTAIPRRFFKPLSDCGGMVGWFLPLTLHTRTATINFRNHRKLLIVDGKEAFIGGMNVGDKYLEWVDLVTSIRGPGVQQIQEVFCDDWYFAVGEELSDHRFFGQWELPNTNDTVNGACSCAIITGGPHQRLNAIRETMLLAMSTANTRIWIMTPYFIPDGALIQTLRMARYRGADVRVVVPAKNNWAIVRRASRAYYPELLDAGIRLFELNEMLHAKATIIDNNLVCIGSANLDQRSFRLNFEMSCFFDSHLLNNEFSQYYDSIQAACTEIMPNDFNQQSWVNRAIDAGFHLFSPVL